MFNLYPGRWEEGERGFAAVPGQECAFERSVDRAIPYGLAAGAKRLHIMAGLSRVRPKTENLFVKNLQKAADTFADFGLEALIEPINQSDMPGYFLSSTDRALALLDQIDRPNVGLQFDVYHHQKTHGDAAVALASSLRHIRHVQIAGVPDRNEPDTKEQLYRDVFKVLEGKAYQGWIGCEYHPRGNTINGLSWIRDIKGEFG